jgi:tetratricopeptide (TPR) repeat protein
MDEDTAQTLNENFWKPLLAFLDARAPHELRQLLGTHPFLLDAAIEPTLDGLLEQVKDDANAVAMLQAKRELLRACREQGVEAVFSALERMAQQPSELIQRFQAAVNEYQTRLQIAAKFEQDASAWQSAIDAGEALLSAEFRVLEGVNWDAAREELANNYNMLGNAHSQQDAHAAALAAFERAIALHEVAMWQRNRAGTLIALKRLDEAQAAIARARALEPDAPRLKELDEELAKAVNSEQ